MHVVHTIAHMDVEWDATKADANRRKHGVDFADAVTALHDDCALTVLDDSTGEERYVSIGMDATLRVVVVVYTWRGEAVRLISARKATARERGHYEVQR